MTHHERKIESDGRRGGFRGQPVPTTRRHDPTGVRRITRSRSDPSHFPTAPTTSERSVLHVVFLSDVVLPGHLDTRVMVAILG